MADWNQFGLDFLSGILILCLGWFIAWSLIHKYQKNISKIQLVNNSIKDVEEIMNKLDEVITTWSNWSKNVEDEKNQSELSMKIVDLDSKVRIFFARNYNQFKNINKRKFYIPKGFFILPTTYEEDSEVSFDEITENFAKVPLMFLQGLARKDNSKETQSELISQLTIFKQSLTLYILNISIKKMK